MGEKESKHFIIDRDFLESEFNILDKEIQDEILSKIGSPEWDKGMIETCDWISENY